MDCQTGGVAPSRRAQSAIHKKIPRETPPPEGGLVQQLSQTGKEPSGRGVEADRDREKQVQKVHRSVLVNPKQTDLVEPQDRVNPGDEVDQVGVESPSEPPLHQ